ncbi:hypothetical protein OSB04_un001515 [Centaurea solstitialis]|uniref:Uncharacterized protein n=1 Tax=Centaurea solstitialis TaxID=347529 RepID=A0AA38SAM8_9ASTR|nr:hypothetical protein OSB04_un001515 [Centaurea solstitialis]
MEDKLNNIWIGSFKLRFNVAKFGRLNQSHGARMDKTKSISFKDSNIGIVSDKKSREREKSYAEVVYGTKASLFNTETKHRGKEELTREKKCMQLRLEQTLIGKLTSFASPGFLGSLKEITGWEEVEISYARGLKVYLCLTRLQKP